MALERVAWKQIHQYTQLRTLNGNKAHDSGTPNLGSSNLEGGKYKGCGGGSQWRDICTPMANSCRCMAENRNTILKQSSSNLKINVINFKKMGFPNGLCVIRNRLPVQETKV